MGPAAVWAPATPRCGSSTGRPTSTPPRTAPPAPSTASPTPPASRSPTARTSTTTTRCTAGAGRRSSAPARPSTTTSSARRTGWPPGSSSLRLARPAAPRPHPQLGQPRGPVPQPRRGTSGATYSLPWQAGITGIAYNPALTGRELTSIMISSTRSSRARSAMLTEMRDTRRPGRCWASGLDPSAVDQDALDRRRSTRSSRPPTTARSGAFTGNDYLRTSRAGTSSPASPGRATSCSCSTTDPDIKFVIPEEGGMSWFDTMVIPKGSPNAYAAADWMNFVYDPVQAAQITAYVQYVTPVKGVQEELVKMGGDAADLADSPILFPDDEDAGRFKSFADAARRARRRRSPTASSRSRAAERGRAPTRRPTAACAAGARSRTSCWSRGCCSRSCSSSSR